MSTPAKQEILKIIFQNNYETLSCDKMVELCSTSDFYSKLFKIGSKLEIESFRSAYMFAALIAISGLGPTLSKIITTELGVNGLEIVNEIVNVLTDADGNLVEVYDDGTYA